METLISQRKYPSRSLGILIQDAEKGTTVVAYNADSMFNPASVTKLLTAALAFEILGPDHVSATRVFADTVLTLGSAVTVRNCYLRGGGDPGFTAERLWLFVEHLYHCGIRKISGDLILDDYFFDSTVVGPGFEDDSTSEAYQPLISALQYRCGPLPTRFGNTTTGRRRSLPGNFRRKDFRACRDCAARQEQQAAHHYRSRFRRDTGHGAGRHGYR